MAPTYKIVLLGEGRVGKTSIVTKFLNDEFDADQPSTVQANMYSKKQILVSEAMLPGRAPLLEDPRPVPVNLSIWDTAGQERFHALGPIYYRNAHGALLVYDVTDADTLLKVRSWITELRAVVGDAIHLVICGNKADAKDRDVTEEQGNSFAASQGAVHFSTSAKTGLNVADAFATLAALVASTDGTLPKPARAGVTSRGPAAGGVRSKRRGVRIAEDAEDEGGDTAHLSAASDAAGTAGPLRSEDYLYDERAVIGRRTGDEIVEEPPRREPAPPGRDRNRRQQPVSLSAESRGGAGNGKKDSSSGCCL